MKNAIKLLTFTCLTFVFLLSCSGVKVNDATIKIRPNQENDGGKIWEVCIDHSGKNFPDKAMAFFEINSKNGVSKTFKVSCIHLKEKCTDLHILSSFTSRFTTQEEWNLLRSLDLNDIDSIRLRIKKDYDDNKYIFDKTFKTTDLK